MFEWFCLISLTRLHLFWWHMERGSSVSYFLLILSSCFCSSIPFLSGLIVRLSRSRRLCDLFLLWGTLVRMRKLRGWDLTSQQLVIKFHRLSSRPRAISSRLIGLQGHLFLLKPINVWKPDSLYALMKGGGPVTIFERRQLYNYLVVWIWVESLV